MFPRFCAGSSFSGETAAGEGPVPKWEKKRYSEAKRHPKVYLGRLKVETDLFFPG
jgi:hypothetical protein